MPPDSKTTENPALELQTILKPSSDLTTPAGFAAPALIKLEHQQVEQGSLLKTAGRVMQDPLLMRKLGDRVYELMLEDLRYQQERSRNYRSRLNA